MANITRVSSKIIITENEGLLRDVIKGFKKDAEIQYFNLLKEQAEKIGLSQVQLKRYVREHLKQFYFNKKQSIYRDKSPPYETCLEEGTFGYEDVYKCAISVANQGGPDLSEDIDKGVIKQPSE
ncbi:MAG: hypothetical protein U9R44_01705, partial [Candidatus Omnitrophota bacterium]|nr:hypothetical protein [Candidatus Omnitrophota bacterium]